MIEILHDLKYQNLGNYGGIVHIGPCRISIMSSSLASRLQISYCALAAALANFYLEHGRIQIPGPLLGRIKPLSILNNASCSGIFALARYMAAYRAAYQLAYSLEVAVSFCKTSPDNKAPCAMLLLARTF